MRTGPLTRTRAHTRRSSTAHTPTAHSRAASGTTCPKRLPRRSPTPSSMSAACTDDVHDAADGAPTARIWRGGELDQLRSAVGGCPPRQRRVGRLLDVHLHQLAAYAGLRAGLG